MEFVKLKNPINAKKFSNILGGKADHIDSKSLSRNTNSLMHTIGPLTFTIPNKKVSGSKKILYNISHGKLTLIVRKSKMAKSSANFSGYLSEKDGMINFDGQLSLLSTSSKILFSLFFGFLVFIGSIVELGLFTELQNNEIVLSEFLKITGVLLLFFAAGILFLVIESMTARKDAEILKKFLKNSFDGLEFKKFWLPFI